MFGFFKRRSGGGATPSLDSVHFDTTGYAFQGEPRPGSLRFWHTPEGDELGLYFFPVPPDLPANAGSVEELAAFYRQMLGESGAKWVEVSVITARELTRAHKKRRCALVLTVEIEHHAQQKQHIGAGSSHDFLCQRFDVGGLG